MGQSQRHYTFTLVREVASTSGLHLGRDEMLNVVVMCGPSQRSYTFTLVREVWQQALR